MIKLISAKDNAGVGVNGAKVIANVVKANPNAVLGLATGSSPLTTYAELIKMYEAGTLSFKNVKSVNLDEYVGLTSDHDQSYAYFMRNNLFDHVNIDQANCNIPSGLTDDPEAECGNYDKLIASLGGTDLQLLGMGPNGHIGFNEPDEVFIPGTHCVKLAESTIDANQRFFASRDDVPRQAYTMGIWGIMQAKKILLVANGKNKAAAIKAAVTGPIDPKVPASILQLHPDFTLVADEAALELVKDLN